MTVPTEDDFGHSKPWSKPRDNGQCQPRHLIGVSILDLPLDRFNFRAEEKAAKPDSLEESHRGALRYGDLHPLSEDPHKRTIRPEMLGAALKGEAGRPSFLAARPCGLRQVPHDPRPIPPSAKRCFDWAYQATGLENPRQYMELAGPGEKGRQHASQAATGIIPPKLCQAPIGMNWGGWGRKGDPGRRRQDKPWDSIQPQDGGDEPDKAEIRFGDSRTKRFPEMTYTSTLSLTRWHLDSTVSSEPRRIHLGTAVATQAGATPRGQAMMAPAGKASGLQHDCSRPRPSSRARSWVPLSARQTPVREIDMECT
eukprot:TRINITY_DN6607_c0_g1_i1.p1 TRINITY_DN6607_c0_g1~~TRINITY_DN6607_c0_g1_i1.p1  ORF type:complete len:311 (+),score=25.91 TRINITY_DN6607_c0_g1_i1:115-1047(+)